MKLDVNKQAFIALVRAGLWENGVQLSPFEGLTFSDVYHIAESQGVIGLVAAGLEHVEDYKVPQEIALTFAGGALQLEKRNTAMNYFVAEVIERLRSEDVYTLLVKGQGIAQCYERPLWRAPGDVDLLLSGSNYEKAKSVLLPLALDVDLEYNEYKHLSMTMPGDFVVELHGTLHSHLSRRVDSVVDEVQEDVFCGGNVRSWDNRGTQVFLPSANNDTIFIFTHILQHFFSEGIGLRQICDWCRLLYTYRNSLNHKLLESRLRKMGLLPHWKAFAALAVDTLCMPVEAIPLYNDGQKWHNKGKRILSLILEAGNFGHGRDQSYKKKYPNIIEYAISFWVFTRYGIRQFMIFPSDAVRGWVRTIYLGVRAKIIKK